MNKEEFIETFVTIDEVTPGQYGHYPFQFISQDKDRNLTAGVLANATVAQVYKTMQKIIAGGSILLHVSIDFPAGLDITDDHVAVFSVENKTLVALTIIPYDNKTGKLSPRVTGGLLYNGLKQTFQKYVLNTTPINVN